MAREEGKAPYLRPGRALTTEFLRCLAEGLGVRTTTEIPPENILARTPEIMVWWTAAVRRVMFFGGGSPEVDRLNGHVYPHPPLVFKIEGTELFVRALREDRRPHAESWLMMAPYWNCGTDGRVCLGTARIPKRASVDLIAQWEGGFFNNQFTHPGGAVRLTSHPGGFAGLWTSLAGSEGPFPLGVLGRGPTNAEAVCRKEQGSLSEAMETHHIHPELLDRQVRVLVVGCGGTGSALVSGLPYLHQALLAYGHPGGLKVTVVDGDVISPFNCVRQPFASAEIGLSKAVVIVNRMNIFWGFDWEAVPADLKPGTFISRHYSGDNLHADIVVGCVDTRATRASIRGAVSRWRIYKVIGSVKGKSVRSFCRSWLMLRHETVARFHHTSIRSRLGDHDGFF